MKNVLAVIGAVVLGLMLLPFLINLLFFTVGIVALVIKLAIITAIVLFVIGLVRRMRV